MLVMELQAIYFFFFILLAFFEFSIMNIYYFYIHLLNK